MTTPLNNNQPLYYSLSIGAKRQFLFPVWESKPRYSISHLFDSVTKSHLNDTNGQISITAAGKIRKAVDWLTVAAKQKSIFIKELKKEVSFKLNFITLTLPAMQGEVTDVEIKNKALNLFLTNCRNLYDMNNYIWKAEAQANGNIHFHITTDIYIHWGDLRKLWNRCLNAFGYVDKYRLNMKELHKDGFKFREDLAKHWSKEDQHKAFMYGCQTGWSNPNTTDVHAVRNVKNLAGYLTKYFCKNDASRRPIRGRLWGMSSNLSKIIKARIEMAHEVATCLTNGFMSNNLVRVVTDYGISYRASATEIITFVKGKLGDTLRTIIGYIQEPPPLLTAEMLTF